jgi:hypothetical protein
MDMAIVDNASTISIILNGVSSSLAGGRPASLVREVVLMTYSSHLTQTHASKTARMQTSSWSIEIFLTD